MSATAVNRLYTTRGGTHAIDNHLTFRETWEVLTNSTDDDEDTVNLATGIPRLGQPHDKFPTAICVEVTADQSDETPFIWYVGVRYDSKLDIPNSLDPNGASQAPGDIPENPLLRPATWRLTSASTSEAATQWYPVDAGGNIILQATAIRNSAKLPFDPPLMVETTRPVIRVTKNVAQFNVPIAIRLEGAVNDRAWFNVPKWCAKISGVEGANKYENGVAYVEVTFDVMLKAETWITQILDAGFYSLQNRSVPTGGAPVPTWTRMKCPLGGEGPFPLDGAGGKLAPGGAPVFVRGLPFNYHLENFALLLAGI